jgi:hypothetical protein
MQHGVRMKDGPRGKAASEEFGIGVLYQLRTDRTLGAVNAACDNPKKAQGGGSRIVIDLLNSL